MSFYKTTLSIRDTVGPFINSTTGAPITTLTTTTLTSNSLIVFGDGATAPVAPTSGSTMTHLGYGYYGIFLQTTDINTVADYMTLIFDHVTIGSDPVDKSWKQVSNNKFSGVFSSTDSTTEMLKVDTQLMNGGNLNGSEVGGAPEAEVLFKKIEIDNNGAAYPALSVITSNTSYPAVYLEGSIAGGDVLKIYGNVGVNIDTNNDGIKIDADGDGIEILSGFEGIKITSAAGNSITLNNSGGNHHGIDITAKKGINVSTTDDCIELISSSGKGIDVSASSNALDLVSSNGRGFEITAYNDAISLGSTIARGININSETDCIAMNSTSENCVNFTSIVGKEDFNPKEFANFLNLSTTVDGKSLEFIYELILAMVSGRFVITQLTGAKRYTFYKQDNSTVLFQVDVTTDERTRL